MQMKDDVRRTALELDSLLKLIVDSRLGSRLKGPLDPSILFGIRCGKSIFAEHHFPPDII